MTTTKEINPKDYPVFGLTDATGSEGIGAPFGRDNTDKAIYKHLQELLTGRDEEISSVVAIARPIMPDPYNYDYDATGHYWGIGNQVWQVTLHWHFSDPSITFPDEEPTRTEEDSKTIFKAKPKTIEVNGQNVVSAVFYVREQRTALKQKIEQRRPYLENHNPVYWIWNDVDSYSYDRAKEAILSKENVLV